MRASRQCMAQLAQQHHKATGAERLGPGFQHHWKRGAAAGLKNDGVGFQEWQVWRQSWHCRGVAAPPPRRHWRTRPAVLACRQERAGAQGDTIRHPVQPSVLHLCQNIGWGACRRQGVHCSSSSRHVCRATSSSAAAWPVRAMESGSPHLLGHREAQNTAGA